MKLIKVKFLKDGITYGRAYIYGCEYDVGVGDWVQINEKTIGEVIETDVAEKEVDAFGRDKLKYVLGRAEKQCPEPSVEIAVKSTPGSVDFNFEEIRCAIAKRVSQYETMVYTEDSINAAKQDRAYLRSQLKAIDEKRKEIKKEFIKPYDEFERKVKEIVALIEKPIAIIDNQVKSYEGKVKSEKKAAIEKIYQECVPESLKVYMPLETTSKASWLNVSTSLKSIREEIIETETKVHKDIEALTDAADDESDLPYILEAYRQGRSMHDALRVIDGRRKMREQIREQEHEAEIQRKAEKAAIEEITRAKAIADQTHDTVEQPSKENELTTLDDLPSFDALQNDEEDLLKTDMMSDFLIDTVSYRVHIPRGETKKFESMMRLFGYGYEEIELWPRN